MTIKPLESEKQIRFAHEFEQHFLRDKAPDKPMLLTYSESGNPHEGYLPQSIIAMLIGAGGIGKTHLLAQLAVAVASGTPFLDCLFPTKPGAVFLGLGENQYDDIHRILYKASKKLRDKQPDLTEEDLLEEAAKRIAPFSFHGKQASFIQHGQPSNYFGMLKEGLKAAAPKEGWSLLIFDPISRLMGADAETDNAAATQFIALMEELSQELPGKPTVLLSHHTNKSASRLNSTLDNKSKPDQSAARGSSALTYGARWVSNYYQEEEGNKFTLKMTKSNLTKIHQDITTEKEDDGFITNCNAKNNKITPKSIF
jgi:RecA-family ATPase